MKLNESRDFKGVWIPKEIYLCGKLTLVEKILYAEIDSLDGEDGCFASNEYFADFLGVTQNKISVGISKLKELGFIRQVAFDGRKRILKVVKNDKAEFVKSNNQTLLENKGRPCEKTKYNNIVYKKVENKENSIKENPNYLIDKEVCDKWNNIAEKFKLPKISKMTDERRLRLAKVLRENELTIEQFFNILEEKLHKSLFLQGLKQVKDGGDWRFECADWQSNFDFYLEKGKMLKVIEDAYTDKMFLK